MEIRPFDDGDAAWAAELMAQRRELYATYSPVFWRPRRGITAQHGAFLARQAQDPANLALRSPHGFLIAQRRDGEGFVDDFAVDEDGDWDGDGAALLGEAWRRIRSARITTMRVVTAAADTPKVAMLRGCGLARAEQWWVLPVTAADDPHTQRGRVEHAGFSGLLTAAPPVYDPGGPVLLVDRIAEETPPDDVARAAADGGAVLAIAPAPPDGTLARALQHRGWTVASEWFVGEPRPLADADAGG